MTISDQIQFRRAIEALRAGVPNRDAVLALGCDQPEIQRRFTQQLKLTHASVREGKMAQGMLIEGGFGTGKSHLLEYLLHTALDANFLCSKIVISKETPLYDPVKFFRAAVESAVVPGKRGDALTEIATALNTRGEQYKDLYQWLNSPGAELNSQFAATLFLYERMRNDPTLRDRIIGFWAGEPFSVVEMRRFLREYEGSGLYELAKISGEELAIQRLKFVTRLIVTAGYSGWILFVDEVELIGRYSLLQRARAYAKLARWIGKPEGAGVAGLSTVFAITDDFQSVVLEGKSDLIVLPQKIRARGTDTDRLLAAQAEQGMHVIQNERVLLKKPDGPAVRATLDKVVSIHAKAYGWTPPKVTYAEGELTTRIRAYVKGWITELDLKRLDPGGKVEIESTPLQPNYIEDKDLQVEGDENAVQSD